MVHAPLFDEKKILRNLENRHNTGNFLRLEVADRLLDRLRDINRSFQHVALVTSDTAGLAQAFPDADVFSPYGNSQNIPGFLGMEQARYDLVLGNLDFHRVNDPVGLCIQIRRALRPDGLFLLSLFAGDTLADLRRALTKAEINLKNGSSARILPFGDVRDLGNILQRSGFALPVADVDRLEVSYQNIAHLCRDLKLMGETNCLADRNKGMMTPRLLDHANKLYPKTAEGRITALFDIAFLTGWHPHENQQKPLKRGSATVSMVTALNKAKPT